MNIAGGRHGGRPGRWCAVRARAGWQPAAGHAASHLRAHRAAGRQAW